MANILFDPKVRRKRKCSILRNIFTFYFYYEDEKVSLKEKIYTFKYNLERFGQTTKGESDWSFRMMDTDIVSWSEINAQFKIDYKEFINK